ncbi:MAG: hypothetical protein WC794_00815 [Candidatus Doudnabacteria bacterium]|jgi:hypothetical protein
MLIAGLDMFIKIFMGLMIIVIIGFIVSVIYFVKSFSNINNSKTPPELTDPQNNSDGNVKSITKSRKSWVSLIGIIIFGGIILNIVQGLSHAASDYR